MFKKAQLLFLYTETPLHVGSGSSLGTVDLPIQRERHTNLPMIQSTGIKGKLRKVFDGNGSNKEVIKIIFGPEGEGASEHAGALSPGDGRLLLFPVRSLAGVFAWITCPLVISRFLRDLKLAHPSHAQHWGINANNSEAFVPPESNLLLNQDTVILEEFSFSAQSNNETKNLAEWLAENVLPTGSEYNFWREKMKKDLVVISDEAFKDFCKFSTDVVSRTKLNIETKIVEKGALWTEENIPSDALLYTPLFACDPRSGKGQDVPNEVENAEKIMGYICHSITNSHPRLQLGGNETVGRGIIATRITNFDEIN